MNMRGLPAIQYFVSGGQIDDIYQSLFDRPADDAGRAYYEALLKDASVADAIAIIGGGARGEDIKEVTPQEIATKAIVAAYEDALGRPGADIDVAGMQFYQDQVLNQGLDATLIDNILAASPEAQQRFGEDVTKRQEEAGAFQNLPGQDFPINPTTNLPYIGGVAPVTETPTTTRPVVPTINQIPTIPYGGTTTTGSLPGLAAIPAPQTFLPAAATAQGRVDPYFLRTAAPRISTDPVTGQPVLQGPTGLFATPVTGAAPTAEGMKEGGMARATPAELGSKFDISEFIDEQGRLVSGYSRPIRDEFGTILGYEERPYERDVVFGEELRRRQAAAPLDSEQAMLDMLARQGRTGVNPMTGGLAGIRVGDPMMRSRPQYYSTIEAGRRYRGFAKGGLADIAQDLASKGRYGDTMVAHISPQEAGILKALGGAGTVNPETGLPEFFSLFPKKGIKLNLGPLGNIKVGAKSSNILQAAAALAAGQYLPPMFNAAPLTVGQTALAYGGLRGLSTGNLMEGIQAGLTAYGMGSAYNSFVDPSKALGPGGLGTGTEAVGTGAGGGAAEAAQVTSQNVPLESPLTAPGVGDNVSLSALERAELGIRPPMTSPSQFTAASQAAEATRAGFPLSDPQLGGIPDLSAPLEIQAVSPENAAASASQGFLGRNLPPAVQEYTPKFLLDASGTTLATGTVLGGSLLAGQQARAAAAGRNAAIAREQEEKRRRFRDLAQNLQQQYPFEYAKGGLASLAGGGMTYMEAGGTTGPTGTPRDVTGTGDGMSDSVPATIEGVQEARLADGEFVIPADVVADIGNGSSDAGSKKLYDMMDRIRMARHGTKEQPPEIKAERLMPA